jgi:hypothetical protein
LDPVGVILAIEHRAHYDRTVGGGRTCAQRGDQVPAGHAGQEQIDDEEVEGDCAGDLECLFGTACAQDGMA